MPLPSSSVRLARKTASADPKWSTSLRDFVGPRPGVNERASHSTRWVFAARTSEIDTKDSERTVISAGEGCQGHPSQWFVNIVESPDLNELMRRLRISAISYSLPSGCARALAEGVADIGIIPAAAYAQIPGLQILPDVAIASRRAVRSILLVSKAAVEKVRTVALDTSSM